MKAFTFLITTVLLYGFFLTTMPTAFLGAGTDVDTLEPMTSIDPTLVTGFGDYENWTPAAYTEQGGTAYTYTIDPNDFVSFEGGTALTVTRKVYYFGAIWLGQYDAMVFIAQDGGDRGTSLSFAEIEADDTNGTVRYDLQSYTSGKSYGVFALQWNITAYATLGLAWTAQEVDLVHGVGYENTAPANALNLVLGLITFTLPDVPKMIQVILASPIYAPGIYLIWFLIKESMPFV